MCVYVCMYVCMSKYIDKHIYTCSGTAASRS